MKVFTLIRKFLRDVAFLYSGWMTCYIFYKLETDLAVKLVLPGLIFALGFILLKEGTKLIQNYYENKEKKQD